jgi:hypothetical protein
LAAISARKFRTRTKYYKTWLIKWKHSTYHNRTHSSSQITVLTAMCRQHNFWSFSKQPTDPLRCSSNTAKLLILATCLLGWNGVIQCASSDIT